MPALVNKATLSFISLFSVHGASELCPNTQLGGTTVSSSGSVRVPSTTTVDRIIQMLLCPRLPALADETRAQALLPNASFLLVPATHRTRLRSRETAQRLQGARCAPLCHSLARWVSGCLNLLVSCLIWFPGGAMEST